MKTRFLHILIASLCVFVLLFSCRKNGPEVISRKVLPEIYAEMLMTDQWIMSTPGVRRMADTSLVYGPILEKYGYTKEDYILTVDKYLDDPERYAKIMEKTVEILDQRLKQLRAEQEKLNQKEILRKRVMKVRRNPNIDLSDYSVSRYTGDNIYYPNDSLDVQWDSTSKFYRIRVEHRIDTLSVEDSIASADSVSTPDSLFVVDSTMLDIFNRYELSDSMKAKGVRKLDIEGGVRLKDRLGPVKDIKD